MFNYLYMGKKYKVNLSYYTYSVLMNDIDAFRFYKNDGSLNKNAFINQLVFNYHEMVNEDIDNFLNQTTDILEKYGLKTNAINEILEGVIRINKKIEDKGKKDYELTFISTSEYESAFLDIEDNYLKDYNFSEYLRKLFDSYARLNQDERERIIFKKEILLIEKAIKENKKILFKQDLGNEIAIPLGVYNSKDRQFAYLLTYKNNRFMPYNLYKLKNLRISREKSENIEITQKELNKYLDSDVQFINSPIIDCLIELTPKGEKLYRKIFINRPKYISKEGSVYRFKCSINQLFFYFQRFGKAAVCLNNNRLNNMLYSFYKDGYYAIKNMPRD